MITIPFPRSEDDLDESSLTSNRWSFEQVICHVCPEVLLSHAADPDAINSDLLIQYLAALYLLVYPLLGSGLGEKVSEVKDFIAGKHSRNLGIIHCHGGEREGRWVLADRQELKPATKVLQQLDGKYACIICLACNPVGEVVELKHSALMYYTGLSPLYFVGYETDKEEDYNHLFYKLPGRPAVHVNVDGLQSLLQLAQAELNPDTVNYFDH